MFQLIREQKLASIDSIFSIDLTTINSKCSCIENEDLLLSLMNKVSSNNSMNIWIHDLFITDNQRSICMKILISIWLQS